MVRVKHRPLTAHDDRQLPEDSGRKIALITGDLLMAPAPNQYHQTLRPYPFTLLGPFLTANSVGKRSAVTFEVRLTDLNVYLPDPRSFPQSRYPARAEILA
jgi:hypothetical protein